VAAVTLLSACADSTTAGEDTPSPTPGGVAGGLSLDRSGAVLHKGDYCHFLQVVTPGNNTLPIVNGCIFYLTSTVDVFATDGGDYSVSEVVGTASLGLRGPNDGKVMIVCRLSPRAEFWFWISADGHWNIDQADDVHHPKDLIAVDESEPLRQYVKTGGTLNDLQFKCAGGETSRTISLALNVNGHQFTALTVPMPAIGTALARPATPWFVDLGARLTTGGTLEGSVANVTLYEHE
jgi:hypothetical protein